MLKLLGMTREYWLAVRFKSAEEKADKAEKADDEKAADVVELKEKQQEGKKMAKTTYTEEQINQAIERAKEIGIHAAGQELGIPWQAVQGFCKKAGVMDEASKKPAKKTKKAASTAPASKPAEKTEPATDLAIENAVLRKENEQLKAKIEKLQKALADLI